MATVDKQLLIQLPDSPEPGEHSMIARLVSENQALKKELSALYEELGRSLMKAKINK
jgi:hypothetical protein